MPEETRLAIAVAMSAKQSTELARAGIRGVAQYALPGITPPPLDAKRRNKATCKADLVRLYLDYIKKHGKSEKERNTFIALYQQGQWPELLAVLGDKIAWKTIETWKRTLKEASDISAIADRRGLAHRGRSILDDRHTLIFKGLLLNPNAALIGECIRAALRRYKAEGLPMPSEATLRRWAIRFMEESYSDFVLWREGKKAWNDKCCISIDRDWSLIGVGDVVFADGHVLNFETINPDTGKAKRMTLLLFYDAASNYPLGWEIMPTENTACISSAFRRACLALGKFPRVVYIDNGRAFKGKFFKGVKNFDEAGISGVYAALGCEVIHAWAYHGQSKTVERFFGTFHDCEVWVPSYTGNDIDHKPARMKRGEVMHRALYDKLGNRPLTLEETHTVIAEWFAWYVEQPQPRSHLKGRSPREIFLEGVGPGVDAAKLNLLMLRKEIRTISKDGIKFRGRMFWHEALSSRRHPVEAAYDDINNPYSMLVYDLQGNFICEARDREHYKIAWGVHPVADKLGTDIQRQDLTQALELKKGQEKLAGAGMKTMLETVVMPEARHMQAALEHKKAMALEANAAPVEKPLSREEASRIRQAKAAAKARAEAKPAYVPCSEKRFKTSVERYEYLFRIKYQEQIPLTDQDEAWMAAFEAGPDFIHCKKRFDGLMKLYERRRQLAV